MYEEVSALGVNSPFASDRERECPGQIILLRGSLLHTSTYPIYRHVSIDTSPRSAVSGHQLPVIPGHTPLSTLDEPSPIFPRSSSKYATTNGALLLAHALAAPPVPSPVRPAHSAAPIAPVGYSLAWSVNSGRVLRDGDTLSVTTVSAAGLGRSRRWGRYSEGSPPRLACRRPPRSSGWHPIRPYRCAPIQGRRS